MIGNKETHPAMTQKMTAIHDDKQMGHETNRVKKLL